MTKKRVLSLMLAGVLAVSMMTACGGNSDKGGSETKTTAAADSGNEGGQAADDDIKISFIMKTLASEHWQFMKAGAEKAAEEFGVTVEIKGPPSETSYDEQQNEIDTDLAVESFDAYCIAPLQSDLVANLIKGETRPIIAVDTAIEAPEVISFVGTGNQAAAKQGALKAVEMAKAAGWTEINCIEIAGVQGDATNTARMNGYEEGITEAGGTFLKDEVQYADAVADKAVVSMEAIMMSHPEGVAIVCANNDDMAVAAARTAQESGNAAYANTIFLGFDGQITACESILEGQLTLTAAQQAYDMGYLAVETAMKAAKGESVEANVDSGTEIVTKDNAQARIDRLKGYLGK
ncbi:MAG: sugar ABC transporter substrate-binding protein [Lachnospiraceae bacterium]|nr:sugar ABC transporter substrate-binding protein [Lachnospiraceae bacterium]